MKIEIKDPLNLKNKEMHVTPTRVKVFVLNNDEHFIFISAFDGLQLPGGHVENNEDLTLAVTREIEEETGIKLSNEEIPTPFFKAERYSKTESNLNKCSTIIYYFIKTDKTFCLENRNLTQHEKDNKYDVVRIHKNNVETELTKIIKTCPNLGSRVVAEETLHAYMILLQNRD